MEKFAPVHSEWGGEVWKADGHGNVGAQVDKSDPELTHVSDALGYLVEREFGLRVAAGLRPKFIG